MADVENEEADNNNDNDRDDCDDNEDVPSACCEPSSW